MERTGIRLRHRAVAGETTSEMGTKAARRALEMAGGPQIDALVVTTVTPDTLFPSTACLIQRRAGPGRDPGVRRERGLQRLHLRPDRLRGPDPQRRRRAHPAGRRGVDDHAGRLHGSRHLRPLRRRRRRGGARGRHPRRDRGPAVGRRRGQGSPHLLRAQARRPRQPRPAPDGRQGNLPDGGGDLLRRHHGVCADAGWEPASIDHFVPHQANQRIIEAAAKRLGLPMERVVVNVAETGNTSSASIPLALAGAAAQGRFKPGDRMVVAAFGAGATWGAARLGVGRRTDAGTLHRSGAAPRAAASGTRAPAQAGRPLGERRLQGVRSPLRPGAVRGGAPRLPVVRAPRPAARRGAGRPARRPGEPRSRSRSSSPTAIRSASTTGGPTRRGSPRPARRPG